MSKILCPFHQENTPSLHVYSDGFKCFGCGQQGSLEQLEKAGVANIIPTPKEPPEDIAASLRKIKSLPLRHIRGFDLHHDDEGFYILWPKNEYYKKRLKSPKPKQSKYLCPKGHSQPPFTIIRGSTTLYLVEGELNALSIAAAIPDSDVISPGGTTQFKDSTLTHCAKYDNIVIVVDNDEAGVMAYIEISSKLASKGINAKRVLMDEDANEVLLAYGEQQLREKLKEAR